MKKLHHFGIPTKVAQAKETYLAGAKVFVTDVADSPNKIEWLRFEAGSPMPELLQTTAHIAYQVDDMQAALQGKQVLVPPFHPMDGVTVAFIVEEGAPIELMHVAN
jgi:hypothetical protein